MRSPKITKTNGNGKRGRRLGGGLYVDDKTHDWFTEKAAHVAEAEHLRRPSLSLILNRIMLLDPDLTQEAVNRVLSRKAQAR